MHKHLIGTVSLIFIFTSISFAFASSSSVVVSCEMVKKRLLIEYYTTCKGHLAVVLADAGGLKEGAPVWLAGIDVGIVRRIRFEDPKRTNRVEIEMEISHDALNKIGKDSQVSVKTRGLLGEKYVDITPSAEIWDHVPERIEGRSVVKLEEVMLKSPLAFDKLNIILDRISRGEGTIGQLATREEPYDKLVRILDRLDRTLAEVESSKGTLTALSMTSASTIGW